MKKHRKFKLPTNRTFLTFFGVAFVVTSFVFYSTLATVPQAAETTSTTTSSLSGSSVDCSIASKIDFSYIMDNSGSMDDPTANGRIPINLLRKFVEEAQPKFKAGDQLQLLTFSYGIPKNQPISDANRNKIVKQAYTTNIASVTDAVKKLGLGANGSVAREGIQYFSETLSDTRHREGGKPYQAIALVLGDPRTNVNDEAKAFAVQDFNQNKVRYYAVSFGGNNNDLEALAKSAGGVYYRVDSNQEAAAIATTLFNIIDQPYDACVSIALSADKRVIREGNNLTFTYNYKNHSRRDVVDASLRHILTSNLKVPNNQAITFSLGTIRAGESGTKTATVVYQEARAN